MNEFDVTLCKFYDNEICYNEECPVKYCDGYQCIYKEINLLREHCKFIDETNKILNDAKESLLKENEELRKLNKANADNYVRWRDKKEEETEKYQELKDFADSLEFKGINKQLQQLKVDNEKLKKQYNCYACGNCNGKEDYINLEKHHNGLRKQYDKYSHCLDEIEEYIYSDCEYNDGCDRNICMKCKYSSIHDKRILQLIKQAKKGELKNAHKLGLYKT